MDRFDEGDTFHFFLVSLKKKRCASLSVLYHPPFQHRYCKHDTPTHGTLQSRGSTHKGHQMAAVGNVSAEAGSHVGVPDSYACCLARPCDCFPTTQDRETIRTHPPSRQAPKSCINLVLSPRACSSL